MQRRTIATLLAAPLIGLIPLSGSLAQQAPTPLPLAAPPGPTTHFPTRFDVVDAPAHFEQVMLIVDFPAGTWTPLHTPGGYVYATVIEGEISTRMLGAPDQEATYQVGSTFSEAPGEFTQVGNASSASARVMATALLPTNAPLTIYREGLTSKAYPTMTDWYFTQDIAVDISGPTTVNHSSIEVDRPAGAFELVQIVLDFNPGIATPRHMHGGQELAMVTTGQMTLQRGGAIELFGTGESWVNTAGLLHAAGNDGTAFAQVVASFLLPAGRPLTTLG